MNETFVLKLSALADPRAEYARVGDVDLVAGRFDDEILVSYEGRQNRGGIDV